MRKLLVTVLVILVIFECVNGDTLDSIIRRRKKIKKKVQQATVEKSEEPIEIPEEKVPEEVVVVNEKIGKRKKPSSEVKEGEIKFISLASTEDDRLIAASESVEKKEKVTDLKSQTKKWKPKDKAEVGEKVEKEIIVKPEVKVVEQKVEQVPEEEVNKERTVTEWMLFRSGVPVDYSYNETESDSGAVVSVPGCPKSIDGYPWVLYQAPSSPEPKCYLVGQNSIACQGSAVMNYQRGSDYGVCACNFQDCLVKRGLPLNPTNDLSHGNQLRKRNGLPGKLRYRFCRPIGVTCEEFVYDQRDKRCDIMYSQGPCKATEWLQRNSKGGVECASRLCESGYGLSEKSELFQRSHGNVTEDNAECCRPWGGFSVASVLSPISRMSCEAGQLYSETLKKCLVPFKLSSLTVG